jgi:4-amino-4-deoxy-L-arabinose transferase-like glycosyltransferase
LKKNILKNSIDISRLRGWQVFLIFSALSVILRFFSFFPSVIDHDESTYLEIARMLLSGKLLYVDMVDIKPPGIFLILAFFQWIFGYSIFVMRLLTALWIGLTAFIVYKTTKLLIKDDKAPLAAGTIYIFLISTWSFYGISITPEIFFNLFTISALYLLLNKQTLLNFFLAGLVAGFGFLVKYLVLFDFTAFLLFLLIMDYRKLNKLNFKRAIIVHAAAAFGFILPFAVLNLAYFLNGHFDSFVNIIYLAPSRYPSAFDPWKMLKFILEFHLLFLPVFFMFYYVLTDKGDYGREISSIKLLTVIWSVLALCAVIIAGKTFGHYTIQLMLPLSLVAGLFFMKDRKYPAFINPLLSTKTGAIILAILFFGISLMKLEYYVREDIPEEIAEYLEPRLNEGDVIYTGNYHHIVYYLLKKDSPTKYVHRSLLLKDKHIKALDINVYAEFQKIIGLQPVYIIIEKDYPAGIMKDYIFANYKEEKVFGDGIKLLRRSPE